MDDNSSRNNLSIYGDCRKFSPKCADRPQAWREVGIAAEGAEQGLASQVCGASNQSPSRFPVDTLDTAQVGLFRRHLSHHPVKLLSSKVIYYLQSKGLSYSAKTRPWATSSTLPLSFTPFFADLSSVRAFDLLLASTTETFQLSSCRREETPMGRCLDGKVGD